MASGVCVRKVHTLDPHTTWLLDRDKSRQPITVTVALSEFSQRMNARGAQSALSQLGSEESSTCGNRSFHHYEDAELTLLE